MKYKIRKFAGVLILTAVLYAVTSFQIAGFISHALAACSGTGCNGLYASSSGCASGLTNVRYLYPASSEVVMRRSSTCNTVWTKTTNTDSQNRTFYANATLNFVASPYNYSVSSGGKIAVNASVVSQQRFSGAPFKSCGYVSANAIPGPVTSPCTTTYTP